MFKTTSKNEQFRASRVWLHEIKKRFEPLSDDEQLESFRSVLRHLDKLMEKETCEYQKRKLGYEINLIAKEMKALKQKVKRWHHVNEEHFIDSAKEILTEATFRQILHKSIDKKKKSNAVKLKKRKLTLVDHLLTNE